ncbi:hypothetical protein ASD14_12330 [Lysobacter sp. Root494]|nr:hypothetical protein ASD14_12330 [Lysobacter sp. Root494]
MLKDDVRNAVFEAIATPLKAAGFKGSRREMSFRRVVPGGVHTLGMPLADYRPTYVFNLLVTVRVDAIEAITLPFSRIVTKYWERSSTLIIGPEFFDAPREHRIRNEAELLIAVAESAALFEGRMLPWLDASTDLASIERQLNAPVRHPGQYTDLDSYAFAGLAAASLCGRQDLDALAARYLAEMKARNFTDTIERFQAFVQQMGLALPD